ncbi:Uncharacterized protein SCF082_LOCUS6946 [Durusdinium trenchii]|uniref:Uncharacterized protein n=1 Tax=Durusdinium trenchii TaxID=1381693 RepID=A0ABP0IFY6_9DINO
MADAKISEIEKHFAKTGRGGTPVPSWTQRQGDWVIVSEAHGSGEDDHYNYGLFHIPSFTESSRALVFAAFTDLSHVGVKGNGSKLRFGEEGKLLKGEGNDGAVQETFDLASLVPK